MQQVATLDRRMAQLVYAEINQSSYYRARYYDATAGRLLSQDPMHFGGGGTNFYAYVKNRPTRLVDPTGRSATVVVGEAGCLLGLEGCLGGAVIGAVVDLTIAVAGSAAVALVISKIKDKIDAKPIPCDRTSDVCYQLYLADGDWCAANKAHPSTVCEKQNF
jgi:RHS repeat-associated protein